MLILPNIKLKKRKKRKRIKQKESKVKKESNVKRREKEEVVIGGVVEAKKEVEKQVQNKKKLM